MSALAATIAALAVGLGAASPAAAMQHACDEVADSVRQAQEHPSNGQRFRVVNVSPDVESLLVRRANLHHAPWVNVWVEVATSAQAAGLYLSAALPWLELSGNGKLSLSFRGNLGENALTFSSSTTMSQVAAAISSYEQVTGVRAIASGTGVKLLSEGVGEDRLVSVQVVDHGWLVGYGRGIYAVRHDDTNVADPLTAVPFTFPFPLLDLGQDMEARVNGDPVQTRGAVIRVRSNVLNADIELGMGEPCVNVNAQSPGLFQAFTLEPTP